MAKLIYDSNPTTKEEKQISKPEYVSREWKLSSLLEDKIDLEELV